MIFFIPCVCDKIKKINGCHNTNDQVTTLLVILLDIWSDSTCPDEHIMIKWSLFDSLLRNIQITINIKNYFQFFFMCPRLNTPTLYDSYLFIKLSIHPIHSFHFAFLKCVMYRCHQLLILYSTSTRWWVWSISGKTVTKENLSQCQFVNHKFYTDWPANEPQPLQPKYAFFLSICINMKYSSKFSPPSKEKKKKVLCAVTNKMAKEQLNQHNT